MKLEMNPRNRLIAVGIVMAALALLFWTQLLSPKRDEAEKLGVEIERLEASLTAHKAEVAEAEAARADFAAQYQRLVVLGKAVPSDDDVASLLVQINRISNRVGGRFQNINLASSGGADAEATEAPPVEQGSPVSATEVSASLLPLGASIGPAGLAVMPYEVTFDGDFFKIADFIKGLDSLVKTDAEGVVVDGRLVTINSFTLEANQESGFPALEASFSLTTYLTPPGEGATGGATTGAPPTAAPVATTTGGAR